MVAEGQSRELVPLAIIATGPDNPHVAALDLLWAERHAIVHVVEIIFISLRKARSLSPSPLRLIENFSRNRHLSRLFGTGCRVWLRFGWSRLRRFGWTARIWMSWAYRNLQQATLQPKELLPC